MNHTKPYSKCNEWAKTLFLNITPRVRASTGLHGVTGGDAGIQREGKGNSAVETERENGKKKQEEKVKMDMEEEKKTILGEPAASVFSLESSSRR